MTSTLPPLTDSRCFCGSRLQRQPQLRAKPLSQAALTPACCSELLAYHFFLAIVFAAFGDVKNSTALPLPFIVVRLALRSLCGVEMLLCLLLVLMCANLWRIVNAADGTIAWHSTNVVASVAQDVMD